MNDNENNIFGNPDTLPQVIPPLEPQKSPVLDPFYQFFTLLKSILFHPFRFYQNLKLHHYSLTSLLSFAMIVTWIGNSFSYLWTKLFFSESETSTTIFKINGLPYDSSSSFFNAPAASETTHLISWMNDVSPIILTPFSTLFQILFSSIFIYIGARIFIPNEKLTRVGSQLNYSSILKLMSLAFAPSILHVFPYIGGMIAVPYSCILIVLGVFYHFQISAGRALLISFFPIILLFLVFLISIFAVLTVILSLIVSIFYFLG